MSSARQNLNSFGEGGDEDEHIPFIDDARTVKARKRWLWLETTILMILVVSIILNVLTYLANMEQDLDDVCSKYTSQSCQFFLPSMRTQALMTSFKYLQFSRM